MTFQATRCAVLRRRTSATAIYNTEFPDASLLVADAGLEHRKGLTNLRELALCGPPITDVGLDRLKGLTELRELPLPGASITDAGFKRLKRLISLRA